MLLTAGPAGQDSLVVIQMCYIGSKEKGQEFLTAISSWDGEKCLLNEVDEKSFLHQQDSVAQVLRAKGKSNLCYFEYLSDNSSILSAGRQWFIRSALITSLPDDIINATVTQFADTPIGCSKYQQFFPVSCLSHHHHFHATSMVIRTSRRSYCRF